MKLKIAIVIISAFIVTGGCITPFMPDINEDQELLVVEGKLTDVPGLQVVTLSVSMPLGQRSSATPVTGAQVSVSDNIGNTFSLFEVSPGKYGNYFSGIPGREYKLNIKTKGGVTNGLSYESMPMTMYPVPEIDNIYYEKIPVKNNDPYSSITIEECQIYLDTEDKANSCRFYRWDYSETWEFHIPFEVPNNICWISESSDNINIKSTSALAQSRISRFPIRYVSNSTDRLKIKYSILVNQYSLSEDEFIFWEKMKNIYENVGSLYDMIPAAIPGNVFCVEDPKVKVLGYFSVSSTKSKRIFIKDHFYGQTDPYRYCITDTIFSTGEIPGLNSYVWILYDHSFPPPSYRVITDNKGCADCTERGTKTKPSFWE
jgi:hypothetical protein